MSEEIKKFNAILANTVKGTIYYMTTWDLPFRPKALRSQAWDLQGKIKEVIEELSVNPLVQSCMSFFLEECARIEKENPNFDHMESDLHVDVFIELLKMWNDSMEVKDISWDKDKEPIGADVVQKIKGMLADFAEELAQKRAAAQ